MKYVVELARALGSMPGVYRVDLLTRQVSAPDVDSSYSEPSEMLHPLDTDTEQEHGESSGAYIIRIPFGPKDKYVPKELLWPHIPEFVDRALSHIMQISKVLGEQIGGGQQVWPVSIHGHYADAGDSAALLSGALNVPMVFTGHSLGRDKLEQLLKQGRPKEEINSNYKIMRRIEAEELCLDASEIIITSTRQEIEEQWRLYDGFDPVLERKLRARMKRGVSCLGRFMPRMVVSIISVLSDPLCSSLLQDLYVRSFFFYHDSWVALSCGSRLFLQEWNFITLYHMMWMQMEMMKIHNLLIHQFGLRLSYLQIIAFFSFFNQRFHIFYI